MHEAHQSAVIFGLDPVWYAGALFILTYTLIMGEEIWDQRKSSSYAFSFCSDPMLTPNVTNMGFGVYI